MNTQKGIGDTPLCRFEMIQSKETLYTLYKESTPKGVVPARTNNNANGRVCCLLVIEIDNSGVGKTAAAKHSQCRPVRPTSDAPVDFHVH